MRKTAGALGAILGLISMSPLFQVPIPETIWNSPLWLQIPLATLVIVVVALFLWFIDRHDKAEREARQAQANQFLDFMARQAQADRDAREAEWSRNRDFLASQNRMNQESLADQRQNFVTTLSVISSDIKSEVKYNTETLKDTTEKLGALVGVVNSVDIRFQETRPRR